MVDSTIEDRARQCLGGKSRSYVEDAKAFATTVLAHGLLEREHAQAKHHLEAMEKRCTELLFELRAARMEAASSERVLFERIEALEGAMRSAAASLLVTAHERVRGWPADAIEVAEHVAGTLDPKKIVQASAPPSSEAVDEGPRGG